MKKILLSAGFAAALLMSVNANAWHGHGGYYRGGWVGPAIVGGVVAGALVGGAFASPYYYGSPYYYPPAPVIVQQPVVVQQQPVYVQTPGANKPAPAGYHWQVMTNPQTNIAQEVLVPN